MSLVVPPPARPIRTWEDAEIQAVGWMRYLGYTDARRTPPGKDKGLDVVARYGVAQVKAWSKQVGRQSLQQLVGAAHHLPGTHLSFFVTGGGYSRDAMHFADQAGIRLFALEVVTGNLIAHNRLAQMSLNAATAQATHGWSRAAPQYVGSPPSAHGLGRRSLASVIPRGHPGAASTFRSSWGYRAASGLASWVRSLFGWASSNLGRGKAQAVLLLLVTVALVELLAALILAGMLIGLGELVAGRVSSRSRQA